MNRDMTFRDVALRIYDRSFEVLLGDIEARLSRPGFFRIVTLNPEILVRSLSDSHLCRLLRQSAIVVADGIGIVGMVRIALSKRVDRITGVSLVQRLLEQGGRRVVVVGGTPEVAGRLRKTLPDVFSCTMFLGVWHGYYSDLEFGQVVEDVKVLSPEIVLVGMGFPKQDYFLDRLEKAGVSGLGIGVGGVLDILSGEKRRAPVWVQRLGMEWFFRVVQDPVRLKRLTFLFPFFWGVWGLVIARLFRWRSPKF